LNFSRSLVIGPGGRREVAEFTVPEVEKDGLILEVELARITERDRKLFLRHDLSATLIPGSIAIGRVKAIGDEAAAFYGVNAGDRVVVEPFTSCYNCKPCPTARRRICERRRWYGQDFAADEPPGLGGTWGQYLYVRAGSRIHKVPDEWEAQIALLMPEGLLAYGALFDAGEGSVGKGVLIDAPTILGLLAAALAREGGLDPITVAGCFTEKTRRLAMAMGAHQVLGGEEEILSLDRWKRPDIFLATSSNSSVFNTGIMALAPGGVAVSVDCVNRLSETAFRYAQEHEICLKSITGPAWETNGVRLLLERARYPLAALIEQTFTLDDLVREPELVEAEYAAVNPRLL
jgi:threonine dehydrogenase-like Zn-dependent dehydrogenase